MIFNDEGLFGFDVSKWQRDASVTPALEIDFSLMKAYGTDFVIMKAGQYDFTDPGFLYNWRASREAGIPRGSYWFLDYRDTARNQAQRYYNLIRNDMGEGIHAADFETGSQHSLDFLYVFLNEFQQLSQLPNHRIAVYTTYFYFIEAYSTSTEQKQWFGKFPLWLAWYSNFYTDVRVPFPWSLVPEQPFLWQNGTPPIGRQVGVRSEDVDHNKLNGGSDKLMHYFGATPNEQGEEMSDYYEVRSTNTAEYRTIRGGPRITFSPIGTFPTGANTLGKGRVDDLFTFTTDSYDGTILKAKAGDQWVHLYEVNGIAVNGWVAVKHMGQTYTTLRLITTTPTPTEYILHVKDGVTRKFIPEV